MNVSCLNGEIAFPLFSGETSGNDHYLPMTRSHPNAQHPLGSASVNVLPWMDLGGMDVLRIDVLLTEVRMAVVLIAVLIDAMIDMLLMAVLSLGMLLMRVLPMNMFSVDSAMLLSLLLWIDLLPT